MILKCIDRFFRRKRLRQFIVEDNLSTWTTQEQELFKSINNQRGTLSNTNPLKPSADLKYAADTRVTYFEMNTNLSHAGFAAVRGRLMRDGYAWAGENISKGYHSVISTFNAFKKSELHYENMIDPNWKYVGISYTDKYCCVMLAR
jgi:uncharacterized protein YkwD